MTSSPKPIVTLSTIDRVIPKFTSDGVVTLCTPQTVAIGTATEQIGNSGSFNTSAIISTISTVISVISAITAICQTDIHFGKIMTKVIKFVVGDYKVIFATQAIRH